MSLVIVQVDSNMKLGEWAGLCKIDQEGKARKVLETFHSVELTAGQLRGSSFSSCCCCRLIKKLRNSK